MGSVHLRSVLCIVLCLFGTACSKRKEYTPQSDDEVPGNFTRFVRVRPDSTRVLLADDDTPLDFELTGEPLNLTVAVNLTRECEAYDLMTFTIEDGRENDTDKQFGLHVLWRISEEKFEVHQSDRLATTTKLEVGWPESDTIYLLIENRNVTAYNGSVSKSVEMCLVSHNETCSFNRADGRMSLAFTTTNDIDCGMYVDIPKRAAIWKVPETERPIPTTATKLVTTDRPPSLVTNNDTAASTSNTSEKFTAVSPKHTTPSNDEHQHGSDDHLAVIIVLSVIAVVLLVCVVLLVILLLRTRRKQNKSKRDRRTKNATANDSTRLLQSVDQTTLTTMSQVTEGSKSATDASKKRTDPAPKEASKKSSSKKETSEVKTKKAKSQSQKDVNQNNEDRRPSKEPFDSKMQPNPSVDMADDAAPPNKMASREVSKTVADISDYKTVPSAKDKP